VIDYFDYMPRFKVRTPQQNRSRASFDRVLDAASSLLAERGHERFTLQEVSRRSGVSIGSIYCRVDSRRQLLHSVQDRFVATINVEHSQLIDSVRGKAKTLCEIIPPLVRGVSDLLSRNAPILRAFMALSKLDSRIERVGKKSYDDLSLKVRSLLLEYAGEIRHPSPEHAVEFCFDVMYVLLGGFLGFGNDVGTAESDWSQLAEELGIVCSAFLLADWKKIPGNPRRFRIESVLTWEFIRPQNVLRRTRPA
jgi:AcrR family transcriptional regulator